MNCTPATNTRAIGDSRYTQVRSIDEKADDTGGGAHHQYRVESVPQQSDEPAFILADVGFQKGPVKEAGVNGIHNEDLLAMVLDRLRCFQGSPFRCRENALAITKIEEGLMWLNSRTKKRIERGVEGTHEV